MDVYLEARLNTNNSKSKLRYLLKVYNQMVYEGFDKTVKLGLPDLNECQTDIRSITFDKWYGGFSFEFCIGDTIYFLCRIESSTKTANYFLEGGN